MPNHATKARNYGSTTKKTKPPGSEPRHKKAFPSIFPDAPLQAADGLYQSEASHMARQLAERGIIMLLLPESVNNPVGSEEAEDGQNAIYLGLHNWTCLLV